MRGIPAACCVNLLFHTTLAEVLLTLGTQTAYQVTVAATSGAENEVLSLRVFLYVPLDVLSGHRLELRGSHGVIVNRLLISLEWLVLPSVVIRACGRCLPCNLSLNVQTSRLSLVIN